jgi:hypothetical protein
MMPMKSVATGSPSTALSKSDSDTAEQAGRGYLPVRLNVTSGESSSEGGSSVGTQGESAKSSAQRYAEALAAFATKTSGAEDNEHGISFSHTGQPPNFDEEFWSCNVRLLGKGEKVLGLRPWGSGKPLPTLKRPIVEVEFVYTLKPGKRPSEAINALFDRSEVWALDCIDYLVAARLFAECRAFGADAFDAKYMQLGDTLSREPMRMDQHSTPGLRTDRLWESEGKGKEFEEGSQPDDGDDEPAKPTGTVISTVQEEDAFLATLPAGTRVMWTNARADADDDWANENTLKIGDDQFIAHPHGVLTAAQLRSSMATDEVDGRNPDAVAAHVAANVYISEVEWYHPR